MKRVIYSLYIDIPTEELDQKVDSETKRLFKEHYKRLVECKTKYAKSIGVDFVLFEYDDKYKEFAKTMPKEITTYNIVNFYKIHLLYELNKEYDEILYLDFDVIPMYDTNFFEVFNLSFGPAVKNNNDLVKKIDQLTDTSQSIRSPTSKFYNAQAMLIEKGFSPENDVINTGIIGINTSWLDTLRYFQDFKKELKLMSEIKIDGDIFPQKIRNFFGYDNETLFAVKLKEYNIPVQWLPETWHYHYDTQMHIPDSIQFVHTINKDFDSVWRKYD
tara:strand:+ start:2888 stop:3706 length:819 start_codon:yes stop_codon:yes gene_type:complete